MRILVTGHLGFLGTHLTKRLAVLGHTIVGLGRGDSIPDCQQLNTYDAVINCAGELTNVDRMVSSNLLYVHLLLESLHRCDFRGRVIQVGSSAETGPVNGARSETTFCDPSNLYEATKLAATNLCVGYARQYDLHTCVLRPFTLYGPGDKPRKMLPTLWRAWTEDRTFECHPGSHDWIHVDDFIEGIVIALNAPVDRTLGQVYHLGTGSSTSNRTIIDLFNRQVGSGGVKTVYRPEQYHPYDVTDWRADITKAMNRLGWSPKVQIEEGIRRFVLDRWFAEEAAPGL